MRVVSGGTESAPRPVTYWCVACNHFRDVVDGSVPVHRGQPMVPFASHPSRVELRFSNDVLVIGRR